MVDTITEIHQTVRKRPVKPLKTIERDTCRVCGAKITSLFSLGNLYVSAFVKKGEEGIRAPLELALCTNEECELLQLKHTAPQELLYARHYWYESGINEKIVNDLREIVEQVIPMATPSPGDIFLDIGANDGTLLSFVPDKFIKIGCEPATNLLPKLRQHCHIVLEDFWSKELYIGIKKAKIITAIGMFYDMEDPNQFIRDVAEALHEDGVFVAQLMTLQPMMETNDIGNICHEHLEYYSYKSLKFLFEKNGLEIFKVEENDINGGSYRIFARHYKEGSIGYEEPDYKKEDFLEFEKRIKRNGELMKGFIHDNVKMNVPVYGYGASTKGNTMLQYYGIDSSLLKGIADRNPDKIGKYTVGTNIPIVSEEKARKDAEIFFILPWGFTQKFIEREREWLDDGGVFAVSVPQFTLFYGNTRG